MQALLYSGIAIATYYLMSIVQALLHRSFGHRRRIRPIFEGHAIGHHGQYPARRLQSATFIQLESHAAGYYGIPIVVSTIVCFAAFGTWVTIAHLAGVAFTFFWHVYLHRQYHLLESPLDRFAWFQKKRRLHFIHHLDARFNFAVVEFWIDTLIGTRKESMPKTKDG